MKKVCFVIPRAYYLFNPEIRGAEDKVGGTQTQTYLLSKSLAKDKCFDVHFLVADFGQKDFEEREGVKIWKSFNFSNNIIKRTFNLLKTLKKINAGTYIFQSADIGVAFALFFVKTFLKKKTIYMLASDVELSTELQKKYSGVSETISMKWVYKNADIITVQTQHQADVFLKEKKRRVDSIIKNIYFPKTIKNQNLKKTDILWVGRLAKIKNPKHFLNLALSFPEENFVMIAPIVMDFVNYGEEVQKLAKEIKNLKLISYVLPKEIYKYYEKSKIYVMSSDLEGFSNTMAEAMMANCAILSYKVNPDNILTKYNCGLYSNGNIELFQSNLKTLLEEQSLCRKLGNNGAEYINNKHQEGKIINKFKDLLI